MRSRREFEKEVYVSREREKEREREIRERKRERERERNETSKSMGAIVISCDIHRWTLFAFPSSVDVWNPRSRMKTKESDPSSSFRLATSGCHSL